MGNSLSICWSRSSPERKCDRPACPPNILKNDYKKKLGIWLFWGLWTYTVPHIFYPDRGGVIFLKMYPPVILVCWLVCWLVTPKSSSTTHKRWVFGSYCKHLIQFGCSLIIIIEHIDRLVSCQYSWGLAAIFIKWTGAQESFSRAGSCPISTPSPHSSVYHVSWWFFIPACHTSSGTAAHKMTLRHDFFSIAFTST